MEKVLIIGSSNVDYLINVNSFPKEGETIHSNSLEISVGGKGLNQAVAAKYSNSFVSFITSLGNDDNKNLIENFLKETKIDYHIIESSYPTGSAYILVNSKSENEIVVNGGANLKIKYQDIDKYDYLIQESDYILLQLELSLEITKYIIDKAHSFNKKIILNPAPCKKLDIELLKKLEYLTPNQGELKDLADNYSFDYIENAKYLISKGVKNIIVTLGSNGSCLINKDKIIHIDPYKVNPIDTTGAGDCYNGYFVSLLSQGYDIETSLKIASKAAGLSTLKRGAAKSYLKIEDVLKK